MRETLKAAATAIAILAAALTATPVFADATDPKTGQQQSGAPQVSSATNPDDLLGRWSLVSVSYPNAQTQGHTSVDVVRCGAAFCGIEVSGTGECRGQILTFKDKGKDTTSDVDGDTLSDRFTGTLDWKDQIAKYYVTVTAFWQDSDSPSKASERKTPHIELDGFPASRGVPSVYDARVYPISVDFKYTGPAKCSRPTS